MRKLVKGMSVTVRVQNEGNVCIWTATVVHKESPGALFGRCFCLAERRRTEFCRKAERAFENARSPCLERKLKRELYLTRIACRCQEAELGSSEGCSVNGVLRSRFCKLQVRMVEDVEELRAEFQPYALTETEVLED